MLGGFELELDRLLLPDQTIIQQGSLFVLIGANLNRWRWMPESDANGLSFQFSRSYPYGAGLEQRIHIWIIGVRRDPGPRVVYSAPLFTGMSILKQHLDTLGPVLNGQLIIGYLRPSDNASADFDLSIEEIALERGMISIQIDFDDVRGGCAVLAAVCGRLLDD